MAAQQQVFYSLLIVCFLLNAVLCETTSDNGGEIIDSDVAEGRTFGHHFLKRMSFAVVPGAFVVGVITTLLAALTVVSMKGLGVGVILLVLAIGQMLSRAIPTVQAAAYHAPAPVPVVYSHSHTQQPVWLEKEW
ncbi:protein apnoia [Stomoxys calcitrans]|uniref:Protein apnoia n=1 Tax=Stomoxys calcitrans TaxID=35570 RepID=A0A1I8P536_STOCA|nr:protein apnoia [Stomoxys calcitrans]XP_013103198.1 protein apnoia [Stomoxys calcitrans]XP_013103206.1 protein apnoia [Stomoxys calcitrans]